MYLVWGPSGTLLKEQGSYSLVQNMGHRGPVLRRRCIGPERAGTQTQFYSILFYSMSFTVLCSNRRTKSEMYYVLWSGQDW